MEWRWRQLEAGETITQATIRESQEEIGVTPLIFQQVAELDFYGGSTDEGQHIFAYVFLCTKWEGEPIESEEMAPKWFNKSEIPYEAMWQGDSFWIPKILDGKTIRAVLSFDAHDNLIDMKFDETTFET